MKSKDIVSYCNENTDIEIQDIFKFIYHSCFGCEHLVTDYTAVLEKIKAEMASADDDDLPDIEFLDGNFCRVHLKLMKSKTGPELLCKFFMLSSEKVPNGKEKLEKELDNLIEYAKNKKIPFSEKETVEAVGQWRKMGFPPIHHSDKFKQAHHPAYRVIKQEYLSFITENDPR